MSNFKLIKEFKVGDKCDFVHMDDNGDIHVIELMVVDVSFYPDANTPGFVPVVCLGNDNVEHWEIGKVYFVDEAMKILYKNKECWGKKNV